MYIIRHYEMWTFVCKANNYAQKDVATLVPNAQEGIYYLAAWHLWFPGLGDLCHIYNICDNTKMCTIYIAQ